MGKRAVLISDIHMNLVNFECASVVLKQALQYAEKYEIPLIIAGDLHDTKAQMRGECVNALIRIFENPQVPVYCIPGNHDRINEKSEEHSLNFLKPYITLQDAPGYVEALDMYLIPYQHDGKALEAILERIPTGATVICHQGVLGADMGHYIQDKTSLSPEAFSRFRTLSGHYHMRQSIECAPWTDRFKDNKNYQGMFNYLGSPYSQSFGEANQGVKGLTVLHNDGSLGLVPTNLRSHIILETTTYNLVNLPYKLYYKDDLLWVKLTGPRTELARVKKQELGQKLIGHSNFKLDLIETDKPEVEIKNDSLTDLDILDTLIMHTDEVAESKEMLKRIARELLDDEERFNA
jgi:DNA repair exonuclease SbcCD nuclease subunit